jgi:hypothetical protein
MRNNVAAVILLRLLCAASLLLTFSGCAATSTTLIEEEVVTNSKPMYRYTSLLIQDFEIDREFYPDASDHGNSRTDQGYKNLPGELAGHIQRYVTSHRNYMSIARGGKPDIHTVVLTGKFLRVGRFKITVVAILRDGVTGQEVARFRETLWDVLDTTRSFADLGREIADFIDRIQYK